MSVFWILPAGLVLLGLIHLVLGVRQMFTAGLATTVGRGILAVGLSISGVALFLVGSNLFTYHQLTQEDFVADIKFRQLQPQVFEATLELSNGKTKLVTLLGDEWQFDVRMIKWNDSVTLVGMRPIYRADRISGRYTDVNEENTNPKSAHSLANNPGVDVWQMAFDKKSWLPWVDAHYGSGTYLPMADGANFNIMISDTGLVARPVNQLAQQATESWQ